MTTIAASTQTALRILAALAGRAMPLRRTLPMAPSDAPAFGLCFVRLTGDVRVVAAAAGPLDRPPCIVTAPTLRSHDYTFLAPIAALLDTYLRSHLARAVLPQIWLPHRDALAMLALLGAQLAFNGTAALPLQRFGGHCLALTREAHQPQPHAVVVAQTLLTSLVVCGHPPSADAHLGAVLAWCDPDPNSDPRSAAQHAAERPAAACLSAAVEDHIDHLLRRQRPTAALAHPITALLRAGIADEWATLARAATWVAHTGFPAQPDPSGVLAALRHLHESLDRPRSAPRQIAALAAHFDACTDAAEAQPIRALRADPLLQRWANHTGHLFTAPIVAIERSATGHQRLWLEPTAPLVMVRLGQRLSPLDAAWNGRICARDTPRPGVTRLCLDLERRRLPASLPTDGRAIAWTVALPRPHAHGHHASYRVLRDQPSPLLRSDMLPLVPPLATRPRTLADLRRALAALSRLPATDEE